MQRIFFLKYNFSKDITEVPLVFYDLKHADKAEVLSDSEYIIVLSSKTVQHETILSEMHSALYTGGLMHGIDGDVLSVLLMPYLWNKFRIKPHKRQKR